MQGFGKRGGRYEGGEEEGQRERGREEAGDGGERPGGDHHRGLDGRCRVHPLLCSSRRFSGPGVGEICTPKAGLDCRAGGPARLHIWHLHLHGFMLAMFGTRNFNRVFLFEISIFEYL